jgi:glycosyltransferase involved in cell wall biosynthesis
MTGRPLVSILITCYNRAHRLPETLASVFAQTYGPVEVIAVDDGSRDGTAELLRSYGKDLRVHSQPNGGVAVARNTALSMARGELVAFQDDDDLMVPDRITWLEELLARHPKATFACGDWQRIDGESRFIPGGRSSFRARLADGDTRVIDDAWAGVLRTDVVPTPHTALFRRDAALQIGGFDTRFFRACEDTDFFARLGRLGPLVYLARVVSHYRLEAGSLTEDSPEASFSFLLLFEKHLQEAQSRNPELAALLRQRMLFRLRQLASMKGRRGQLPDRVPQARLEEMAALLTASQRARLAWHTSLRVPARTFVRRSARSASALGAMGLRIRRS